MGVAWLSCGNMDGGERANACAMKSDQLQGSVKAGRAGAPPASPS